MMKASPLSFLGLGLVSLALASFSTGASAQTIVANFTGGNGNTSVDQYVGIAGDGWSNAWASATSASGGTTGTAALSATVVNTSPLHSGGNYLSLNMTASGDRTQYNAAVYRNYTNYGSVSVSQPYSITFDIRADSLVGFSAAGDFVGFFGGTGTSNFTTNSTWCIRALGGVTSGKPSFTWLAYDGGRDGGSYAAANLVVIGGGEGLAFSIDTIYSFTIDVDPATGSYDVSVTDGLTTVASSNLGFRSAEAFWAGTRIGFGGQVNSASDSMSLSIDNIAIIPEPSTAALLLGASLAGFLFRRRKP